ncbi:MAG TPA: DUF488 domain-containing protein [Candidatus Baltobacteraceae bacterium]
MPEPRALLTLGHGTASAEELSALIRGAEIEAIVDVRSVPKSRRHPQYWSEAMAEWVPRLTGSSYRWEPALGGFRAPDRNSPNVALRHPSFRAYADYMETAAFAEGLDALLTEARATTTAVLCSETLWWRCHRRLIADAAMLLRGETVLHLMHDGKLRPHVPTAGARVTAEGGLRYDVLLVEDAVGDA